MDYNPRNLTWCGTRPSGAEKSFVKCSSLALVSAAANPLSKNSNINDDWMFVKEVISSYWCVAFMSLTSQLSASLAVFIVWWIATLKW